MDEVLLTIDLHRSSGRFGSDWESGKDRLLKLVQGFKGVRVEQVDYSQETRKKVEMEWCGGRQIPLKDFRGGPSYAYFFGLSAARGRYVIHSDSDLFFGGRSTCWVNEAIDVFARGADHLFLGPLSGPPNLELRIRTLRCIQSAQARGGHSFDFMSTRFFMLDRARFKERIGAFIPTRPNARSFLKALVERNPPWDLPEHWMTEGMRSAGMARFDFLGEGKGMWYLHPPYRCEDFYAKLPRLCEIVESGHLPHEQQGCHDINESLVDWSAATDLLRTNRWWRRLWNRFRS